VPRDLIQVKLELIVRGDEKNKRITGPGEHPPCFKSLRQYEAWKKAASADVGSPPPVRKDWPKEPNYCRDCMPDGPRGRNQMRLEGKCLFPNTIFEEVGDGEEREIVGTSK
jgi:hypothetical protein